MRIPYEKGGCRVTSPYGNRVLNGVSGWHAGIDLVGENGDRVLVAPCDGIVRSSTIIPQSSGNTTWEWGNYVRIDSNDGYTIYMCHMERRFVSAGQAVKAGDPVGIQGNTGYSFGEHCHFEVRKNGVSIDPSGLIGIQNKVGIYRERVASAPAPTVGDSVRFAGTRQFASANGWISVNAYPCDARITAVYQSGKHPYHLVGNGVYGWVDAGDIFCGAAAEDAPQQAAYTLNGYTIERVSDFSIKYWDQSKKKGTASSYINGGFFGYYKEGGASFTLPVGNLVCDVPSGSVRAAAQKYIQRHISGTKLRYGTAHNATDQFKGRAVTTLVLPALGAPFVEELTAPPAYCRYAISGIPVIRGGKDVSYNKSVIPQGWDTSCFYATSRNFIGIRGTSIWVVSGTTKTTNFVATSEVYEKLKTFGFDELISLDGGGSFYHKYKGKADVVWADRNVNNLILY